ncbi:MAG TPA: hypothetical protein VHL80_00160 [Polyangia bacterium]|nr:hypothetical protein [Polyangia bacterium]
MPDDEGIFDDKDEGSHRIENDPARGGKGAPGKGHRDDHGRRRGQGKPDPRGQPGGGHQSESEKPSSPDSRWGGGRNP